MLLVLRTAAAHPEEDRIDIRLFLGRKELRASMHLIQRVGHGHSINALIEQSARAIPFFEPTSLGREDLLCLLFRLVNRATLHARLGYLPSGREEAKGCHR